MRQKLFIYFYCFNGLHVNKINIFSMVVKYLLLYNKKYMKTHLVILF